MNRNIFLSIIIYGMYAVNSFAFPPETTEGTCDDHPMPADCVGNDPEDDACKTITLGPTEGGKVTIEGNYIKLKECTIVKLGVTSDPGFEFDHWDTSSSILCTGYKEGFNMPADGLKCIAQFKKVTYTVTPAYSGKGTGTVTGNGSFTAGDTVTLVATPEAGSTFAGWTPSPCAVSFTMPTEDLTCIAQFDKVIEVVLAPVSSTKPTSSETALTTNASASTTVSTATTTTISGTTASSGTSGMTGTAEGPATTTTTTPGTASSSSTVTPETAGTTPETATASNIQSTPPKIVDGSSTSTTTKPTGAQGSGTNTTSAVANSTPAPTNGTAAIDNPAKPESTTSGPTTTTVSPTTAAPATVEGSTNHSPNAL